MDSPILPKIVTSECLEMLQGYLPMAHEFDRGGYEVEIRSTYFERGTADELLNVLLGWVERNLEQQEEQRANEQATARL